MSAKCISLLQPETGECVQEKRRLIQVMQVKQSNRGITTLSNQADFVSSQSMQWLLDLTEEYRGVLRGGSFYKALACASSPSDIKGWVRQLYYLSSDYISSLALRHKFCREPGINQDFEQHFFEESAHPEQLIYWMRKYAFLGSDEHPISVPATLETVALTSYFSHSVIRKPIAHQVITLNLVSEGVAFDFYSAVIPKLVELGLDDGDYWQAHTELDQEHLTVGFHLIPQCEQDSLEGQGYARTVWEMFSLYSQMLDSWSGTSLGQKLELPSTPTKLAAS